jgi:hypothetical protein
MFVCSDNLGSLYLQFVRHSLKLPFESRNCNVLNLQEYVPHRFLDSFICKISLNLVIKQNERRLNIHLP